MGGMSDEIPGQKPENGKNSLPSDPQIAQADVSMPPLPTVQAEIAGLPSSEPLPRRQLSPVEKIGLIMAVLALVFGAIPANGIIDMGVSRLMLLAAYITAIVSTFLWEFYDNKTRKRIAVSTGIMALFLGLFLFGFLDPWIIRKRAELDRNAQRVNTPITPKSEFEVYPPFRPVYDIYKAELGEPLAKEKASIASHQATHEFATLVWFQERSTWSILFRAGNEVGKWEDYPDSVPASEDDSKNWTEKDRQEWRRRYFHTPEGKQPPYGGVAKLCALDPNLLPRIGHFDWHGSYANDVFYQEFKGGIIIGALLSDLTYKRPLVYVLLKDGNRWFVREGYPMKAPVWKDPTKPIY